MSVVICYHTACYCVYDATGCDYIIIETELFSWHGTVALLNLKKKRKGEKMWPNMHKEPLEDILGFKKTNERK